MLSLLSAVAAASCHHQSSTLTLESSESGIRVRNASLCLTIVQLSTQPLSQELYDLHKALSTTFLSALPLLCMPQTPQTCSIFTCHYRQHHAGFRACKCGSRHGQQASHVRTMEKNHTRTIVDAPDGYWAWWILQWDFSCG